jgi:hypothetical protein
MLRGEYGPPYFASMHATGTDPFASINHCVNASRERWSITMRPAGKRRMYGYAGSLGQAKRMVKRWAIHHCAPR